MLKCFCGYRKNHNNSMSFVISIVICVFSHFFIFIVKAIFSTNNNLNSDSIFVIDGFTAIKLILIFWLCIVFTKHFIQKIESRRILHFLISKEGCSYSWQRNNTKCGKSCFCVLHFCREYERPSFKIRKCGNFITLWPF